MNKNLANKIDIESLINTNENFAELFEHSVKDEKKEGTIVKGTVLLVTADHVVIDIGLKTEGRVPLKEFEQDGKLPEILPGQEVEVYLERTENKYGRTILSREKALLERTWNMLEQSFGSKANVNGAINSRVKGGFTVDLGGVIAFLPGSQVDVRPVKDITPLLGVNQPFQILKMDKNQGNIVVSRRAILEESRAEARHELLAQVYEGMIMDGVVKNITDYGAFIDLGSVDGLLHVTDISWNKITHPSEMLTLGQNVKVKVIKFNPETKRISLGIKQLEENPWDGMNDKYPLGGKHKGVVTSITDYGVFVELAPGIEGLVHVSEFSWLKNNLHPKKLFTTGQEVEVMVLEFDIEKHRIGLGIKQCEDNPWASFAVKYPIGSMVEGEIKNIVEFGLFIGLEGGIDGLIHISDLSWDEDQQAEIIKNYNKDEVVKAVVLGIDSEKERISLGVKQMNGDPFEAVMRTRKKGDVVTCTVTAIKDDGIEVSIENSVISFIKRADIAKDKVDQRPERFAIGDRIDAKITSVEKDERKINASIKALEVEEQKRAIAEFGSADSGASLGEILGAALSKSSEEK